MSASAFRRTCRRPRGLALQIGRSGIRSAGHPVGSVIRTVDVATRRALLVARHHLAPDGRAETVVEAAASVVGLHATDPASVYLAARARTVDMTRADLDQALYDDRSLVRMLGMRRTVFVLPVDLAPVVHAGCTQAIAARERRRLVQLVEQAGVAKDGGRWVRKAEEHTLAVLHGRGEATAAELSADVPALRERFMFGEGKKWGGEQGLSTRVLFLLAADGHIVRGRPRGSWTSTQYRWAPIDDWVPGGLPELPPRQARAELAGRWLAAFGPGTADDVKWWTGWTGGETKQALADAGAVEVALAGVAAGGPTVAFVHPDDHDGPSGSARGAAFLPALDPTVMGWANRDWYLGPHRAALFDRSGNAGPTVWWEGRVVGGWAQRPSGEVVHRLLEGVGGEAERAIASEAASLEAWFGPSRVKPRFRAPLDIELSSS